MYKTGGKNSWSRQLLELSFLSVGQKLGLGSRPDEIRHGWVTDPEVFFSPRKKWLVFFSQRLVFFHGRFLFGPKKKNRRGIWWVECVGLKCTKNVSQPWWWLVSWVAGKPKEYDSFWDAKNAMKLIWDALQNWYLLKIIPTPLVTESRPNKDTTHYFRKCSQTSISLWPNRIPPGSDQMGFSVVFVQITPKSPEGFVMVTDRHTYRILSHIPLIM